MTLHDFIMASDRTENFTTSDWEALGRGEINDQEIIDKMLSEGYEAVGE